MAPKTPPSSPTRTDNDELARWREQAEGWSWWRVISFFVAGGGYLSGAWHWILPVLVGVPGTALFVWALLRHERIMAKIRSRGADEQLATERDRRRRERRSLFVPRKTSTGELPATSEAELLPLEAGAPLHLERDAKQQQQASSARTQRIDEGTFDDISLFEGELTLFGLMDQSSTCFGNWRWQRLFRQPILDAAALGQRQLAVAEIADPNLLHEVQRTLLPCRELALAPIPREFTEPPFLPSRRVPMLATLLGAAVPVSLLLTLFFSTSFAASIPLCLVLNMALIGRHLKATRGARRRLDRWSQLLPILLRLSQQLSKRTWKNPQLLALREAIVEAPLPLLRRQLLALKLQDLGALGEILNIFTLWELQFLPRAERHLLSRRTSLEALLAAVGELEVLVAQASWVGEPGFCQPQLEEDFQGIRARQAAHPLLPREDAVPNPIDLDTHRQVLLLTGSNMAGKSTYLRAVATNHLLALTGSWVCAEEWRGGVLALQSNVHVRDSLAAKKSYFQAEVERVREIIAECQRESRTLTIMDELFRGTNAEERLVIARSLIRYLRDTGVILVVATHDTRLSEMATSEKEAGMVCGHFRERFVEGVMRFDYVFQEGPVQSRNAISVLEAAGYDPKIVAESRRELASEEKG